MYGRLHAGLILLLLAGGKPARAEQLPGFEKAASQLQSAVVTVRVTLFPSNSSAGNASGSPRDSESASEAKNRVTICSGVSLGDGLIVTPAFAASDSLIRITLAGGEQATAALRVIDEYSGLSLLETDRPEMPGIELASREPAVGAWVLGAAAWGVEKPVVSLGIVSGRDRNLAGMNYPPLLQCSLASAETSSGAAVVERDGKLLGIIVASDVDQSKRGWTYAVPVRHVKRLLRARQNSADQETVVVLKRRRPVVGMILEGNPDRILVKRVHAGSPAEKAGIRVGDQILEADGIKIRSVYQALRPVLYRQPGDAVVFRVRQQDGERDIEVALGGGIVLPSAPFEQLGQVIQPKIEIDETRRGLVSRTARGAVRELFAPGHAEPAEHPPAASSEEKIKLLERALEGYRNVILYQQSQLSDSEKKRLETEQRIQQLQAVIEALKKQALDAGSSP